MKKILLAFMAVTLVSSVSAWGLQLGMTGAVKSKVTELDKKVHDYKVRTEVLTGAPITGSLVLKSVKQGGGSSAPSLIAKTPSLASSFTTVPATRYGWINSGAPDYLKVTLKEIEVQAGTRRKTVWTGSKEFTLDGGSIDTSDITLDLVETDITKVVLYFDNAAKIKGTLTAKFNMASGSSYTEQTKIFNTKAAYAYDSFTHTGGDTSYTSFEGGSAEEASVSLSLGGSSEYTMVEIPVLNGTIDAAHAKLTILVDLNRMLRFYVGLNTLDHGGVNPDDPANKAYFFCHSVFSNSIAAFIGDAGSIQGYQTSYASYEINTPIGAPGVTPAGVPGWMTLIYDAGGNLLSGMLIGDDDNSLTIAKGCITSYNGSTFVYSIDSDQSVFSVTGFEKQTTLNNSSPVAAWEKTKARSGDSLYHGEAIFKLLFQQ
jgi:hypothetical protein